MEYEDAFEMLEAVRTHVLGKGERMQPLDSVKGTHVGFTTADSDGPATRWTISVQNLRLSCEARISDEAKEVLSRMRAYQDRRQLVEDLRSGKFSLEERPYMPVEEKACSKPVEEVFIQTPSGQDTLDLKPASRKLRYRDLSIPLEDYWA